MQPLHSCRYTSKVLLEDCVVSFTGFISSSGGIVNQIQHFKSCQLQCSFGQILFRLCGRRKFSPNATDDVGPKNIFQPSAQTQVLLQAVGSLLLFFKKNAGGDIRARSRNIHFVPWKNERKWSLLILLSSLSSGAVPGSFVRSCPGTKQRYLLARKYFPAAFLL